MENDTQPIPRISKVVDSLPDYIRRPSHGERHMEFRHLTYDFMRSGIEKIEGIKLTI
jgi:hypothetical protein